MHTWKRSTSNSAFILLWEQWNFPCSIQLQVLRCSDRMSPLIILLTRCFLFWGNTQQNYVSFDSKLFTTKNGIKTCFGQQSMQQIKALFSIRWCKGSMRNMHMKLLALDMARMHLKQLYHQFISNSVIACCVLSVLYIYLKWLFRFILKSNAFL